MSKSKSTKPDEGRSGYNVPDKKYEEAQQTIRRLEQHVADVKGELRMVWGEYAAAQKAIAQLEALVSRYVALSPDKLATPTDAEAEVLLRLATEAVVMAPLGGHTPHRAPAAFAPPDSLNARAREALDRHLTARRLVRAADVPKVRELSFCTAVRDARGQYSLQVLVDGKLDSTIVRAEPFTATLQRPSEAPAADASDREQAP